MKLFEQLRKFKFRTEKSPSSIVNEFANILISEIETQANEYERTKGYRPTHVTLTQQEYSLLRLYFSASDQVVKSFTTKPIICGLIIEIEE